MNNFFLAYAEIAKLPAIEQEINAQVSPLLVNKKPEINLVSCNKKSAVLLFEFQYSNALNQEKLSRITKSVKFSSESHTNPNAKHDSKEILKNCYWDEVEDKLTYTLPPFDDQMVFYTQKKGVVYLSSEAWLITKLQGVDDIPNLTAMSKWLAGIPSPCSSLYQEIKQLSFGKSIEIHQANKIRKREIWDINPEYKIRYQDERQYYEHFQEILKNSVEESLGDYSEHVFSQLSGGMDSSSITAIAQQLLLARSQQLRTISHTYKSTPNCDESEEIEQIIQFLKIENSYSLALDNYEQESFKEVYPIHPDGPGLFLSAKYHQEMGIINDNQGTLLLTGNGGDEMCWGHSTAYNQRFRQGDIKVVFEVLKACKQLKQPKIKTLHRLFIKPNLKTSLNKLLNFANKNNIQSTDLPPWLTNKAIDAINNEQNFKNPFSNTIDTVNHHRYQLIHNSSTYNAMRSYQKVADAYNISIKHPFFNKEVAAFSFAVPEKLLIKGAYPKYMLRKTMEDQLPQNTCWDTPKVIFDQHFAKLVKNNYVEIKETLSHPALHELGLVDTKEVILALEHSINGTTVALNVDLLYTILTHIWYQTHMLKIKH